MLSCAGHDIYVPYIHDTLSWLVDKWCKFSVHGSLDRPIAWKTLPILWLRSSFPPCPEEMEVHACTYMFFSPVSCLCSRLQKLPWLPGLHHHLGAFQVKPEKPALVWKLISTQAPSLQSPQAQPLNISQPLPALLPDTLQVPHFPTFHFLTLHRLLISSKCLRPTICERSRGTFFPAPFCVWAWQPSPGSLS